MTPEKRKIIQSKLKEFLALSPEEKHAIDSNPKYDGLFSIIQEIRYLYKAHTENHLRQVRLKIFYI